MPTWTIRIAQEVFLFRFRTAPYGSIAIPRFVPLFQKTFEQTHVPEQTPRRRHERLAHTRRDLRAPLDQDHALKWRKVYGRRGARRASAYNHDVCFAHLTSQAKRETMDFFDAREVHIVRGSLGFLLFHRCNGFEQDLLRRQLLNFHRSRKLFITRSFTYFHHSYLTVITNHVVDLIGITLRAQPPDPRGPIRKRSESFSEWTILVHHDFIILVRQDLVRHAGRPERRQIRIVTLEITRATTRRVSLPGHRHPTCNSAGHLARHWTIRQR